MGKGTTRTQVSAGGVAFRKQGDQVEVALISVGNQRRWQLPKGLVNKGETKEIAAVREVQEETGVDTELIRYIDKVEYWYYAKEQGETIRFHKFVFFYLLKYLSGDVMDHDQEVNEAAWMSIQDGIDRLSFESEKKILDQAKGFIDRL